MSAHSALLQEPDECRRVRNDCARMRRANRDLVCGVVKYAGIDFGVPHKGLIIGEGQRAGRSTRKNDSLVSVVEPKPEIRFRRLILIPKRRCPDRNCAEVSVLLDDCPTSTPVR